MTRTDILGLARAAIATAVVFLAGAVVPVIGAMATLFTPIALLGFAVGRPRALWRMAAGMAFAAAIIALVAGPLAAAAYGLTFGLATAVICLMLERQRPFERIVLSTTALLALAGTLAAFAMAGSPAALADGLRQNLTAAMVRGEKFYHAVGIEAGIGTDLRASIVDVAVRLSPALMVISVAFMVLANLGLFWRMRGHQQQIGYLLFGDLVRWTTPEWLIWVLLVSGFGLFIPEPALATIALNCFLCVAAVYFCQGLAIMAFYFKMLAMPPLARGLIYFVTGVQPVLAALVCTAGIFDLWIDFRRLKPPSQEARNLGDYM